jgi:hypothetical protein
MRQVVCLITYLAIAPFFASCASSSSSPSSGGSTTYTGAFSGPFTTTFPGVCASTEQFSGTLELQLEIAGSEAATGTASIDGTRVVTVAGGCTPQVGATGPLHFGPAPVTGTASSLAFTAQTVNTFPFTQGGVYVDTRTFVFSGALNGPQLTGTLTHTETTESPGSPTATGAATFPVMLQKQ